MPASHSWTYLRRQGVFHLESIFQRQVGGHEIQCILI